MAKVAVDIEVALTEFQAKETRPIWRAQARYAATILAVALAYFVVAKLGLQLASINPSASPIWPPTGIALAAVLLGGYRIWPAIFLGALAANATTAGSIETSVVIAMGNTLEGVVGGYLINRWSGGSDTFASRGAGREIRPDQRRSRRPSSAPPSAC